MRRVLAKNCGGALAVTANPSHHAEQKKPGKTAGRVWLRSDGVELYQ